MTEMKKGGLMDGGGSEWEENDHPRDNDGKFAGNGGTSSMKETDNKDISSLLGSEYKGIKGQAAVAKLMQEKQGHIKAAFERKDIGSIDLVWGNDDIGLQHIIKRRNAEGLEVSNFVLELTNVVETGEIRKSARGNYEILKNKHVAVVQPEFKGNQFNFVVTAYRTRKDSWQKP